jgi:hypothetical protein
VLLCVFVCRGRKDLAEAKLLPDTQYLSLSTSRLLETRTEKLPAGRRFHSRTFRSGPYQPHLHFRKNESVLLLDMRLSNIAYLLEFEIKSRGLAASWNHE